MFTTVQKNFGLNFVFEKARVPNFKIDLMKA